ncbi:cytochrome c-type biogenesis protein CcmE [Pseudomonas putida S11]|nr:cytochrome c-type biogenesis protein CcmE [Pseudomonas putida S11]
MADEVLAKHDEKYMPPEVTKALKESGQAATGGEARP